MATHEVSVAEDSKFRSAPRLTEALTAKLERRALIWMAERMPARINSDHLTLLGFAAQFLAAALPDDVCHTNPLYNPYEYRLGNEDAKIVDFLVLNERAANPGVVYAGSVLDIYVKVHFEKAFEAPLVGLQFKTKDGVIVFGTHSGWLGATTAAVEAGSVHCYRFRVKADLVASTWFMNLAVAKDEGVMCDWRCSIANIELVDDRRATGYARLNTAFQAMT